MRTWRTAFAPARSLIRLGRSRSQPATPRAERTCGLPCSERPKPARETSTRSGRRPGFRTVIAAVEASRSVNRSGLALRPMPRPAAAPGMDAAGRTEDQRDERAFHLPITVNVSVAV